MHIRRLPALTVVLAVFLSAAQAVAQRANSNQPPARPQPDPDTVALVQMVDADIVATPTVQVGDTMKGEVALKWDSSHFIKGQNGVYIPFTLTFDPASIRTSEISIYVRAVEKDRLPLVAAALTPPAAPAAGSKPAAAAAPPKYAWDNVHFLAKPADGRITRAIALPAGDYELFVAVKERSVSPTSAISNPPGSPSARTGLLRHAVLAPDFSKAELQTSSVLLANTVEPVSGQLSPAEQEANPYVFGPMRIVPSRDGRFAKTNELQVIFWVYGASAVAGKPDVLIEYNFYLKQPDGVEKYFNKTAPQELNAKTLPPEFNAAAGHQLPGSLVVPLTSFPPGDYRLEIKVTDKPSGKVVTQNVAFSVTG